MLIMTASHMQDRTIVRYLGLVSGQAVIGSTSFQNLFATIEDVVPAHTLAHEQNLARARTLAIEEMVEQARELGANAIVGVDLDYETIAGTMLMVSAAGTAVIYQEDQPVAVSQGEPRTLAAGAAAALPLRREPVGAAALPASPAPVPTPASRSVAPRARACR
jgi:uncharacterized protein YbjQ (UPF0145 family)